MSPRRPKVSDEEIFAAAGRVMSRVGPAQLMLADIAAEAGLTAGALVQRFGSRRDLLLAVSAHAAETTPSMFDELRAAHASPLAVLRAYADCMAAMGESPGALAHHLAYLQLDLTDPDFHRHTMTQAHATRAALRDLVTAAMNAGELVPSVDPDSLARTIEVTVGGSLMAWAFYREGPAIDWVREDLDAVLRPYLTTVPPRPSSDGVSRARRGDSGASHRPPTNHVARRRSDGSGSA
jgi:AcrR family transcriptional regulator